jgi:hypothetical protein
MVTSMNGDSAYSRGSGAAPASGGPAGARAHNVERPGPGAASGPRQLVGTRRGRRDYNSERASDSDSDSLSVGPSRLRSDATGSKVPADGGPRPGAGHRDTGRLARASEPFKLKLMTAREAPGLARGPDRSGRALDRRIGYAHVPQCAPYLMPLRVTVRPLHIHEISERKK